MAVCACLNVRYESHLSVKNKVDRSLDNLDKKLNKRIHDQFSASFV